MTCPVKCGIKLVFHSPTSTVAPLNTFYNGCNYLSMLGLTLNHFSKRISKQSALSGFMWCICTSQSYDHWRLPPSPRQQCSWSQHGAHLGPVGPRWAPCWPHEPCYKGRCQWSNLVWTICVKWNSMKPQQNVTKSKLCTRFLWCTWGVKQVHGLNVHWKIITVTS